MFEPNDQLYYTNRAAHAMALCNQATRSKIAEIHFELALRYSLLAAQSPRTQLDLVAVSNEGQESRVEYMRSTGYVPDRESAAR